MSLRWFYRPSWQPLADDPAVEFTDSVRLYTLDVTEDAEEGSTSTSKILVDDPLGVLDFPPLTRLWATETEISASSNTFVYHGYIADRNIKRGNSALTTVARIWEVSVTDENSILSRRVMSSASANRPVETDVDRVEWLANEADGQLLIDSTEFLFHAGAVTMDAVDYRGQTALDVLADCMEASGKNCYAYFKEGVGSAIWYGSPEHTAHQSMVRLSNDLADIDNLTTFAIGDGEATELWRDPSRLVSGIYAQWASGATYVRNQAMFAQIGMRDRPMSFPNVKTVGRAEARANRLLADLDTEMDRITTSVYLPAAKVNWIKAGMRLEFKATHLPGYESFTFLRVLKRGVAQVSEEFYLLTLELSTNDVPEAAANCAVTGDDADGVYGTVFGPTASGFYPHNSVNGTFGDYVNGMDSRVFYMGSGGGGLRSRPRTVTSASTGAAGGWSFAQHGVAKAGMPLGTADGGAAVSAGDGKVQIMVVGPGTLTIWATSTDTAQVKLYRNDLNDLYPAQADSYVLLSTGSLSFPSTNIVVPDDGACLHFVTLIDDSAIADKLFYGGHTWAAA